MVCVFVLLILCVFFRKTKRGRCAAEKLHKFLGQSKQTELVPGTRRPTNPGIKPESPAFQAYSLPSEPPGKPQYKIFNTDHPVVV